MNLRQALFILPNLMTVGNIFCGFFALALCSGTRGVDNLYGAALAICFGICFDLLDGGVARLTKTQSALGVELDSLADIITFGAAPAMLVYKWGLSRFGLGGIFVAFLFLAAAALRLARYNVLEKIVPDAVAKRDEPSAERYFLGLPTTAAASVIVALVVGHYGVGGTHALGQGAIAVLVIILAYLMVSRVRFRSLKGMTLSWRTVGISFLVVLTSLIIFAKLRGSFIFIFLISCYLALSLAEEVYRYAANKRGTTTHSDEKDDALG